MGRKLLNLLLFLILIVLIIGIIFGGIIIYQEFFEDSPEQVVLQVNKIFSEEPDTEKKPETETTTTSIGDLFQEPNIIKNNETTISNNSKYFYSQLNNTQKAIYDGLMQNKSYLKQGNYTIQFGTGFTDILSQDGGADLLGDEYQAAIEAFTHDNMDVFYLDVNKMYLNIETRTKFLKTTYNVYISAAKDSNYLSKEFQSTEKIERAIFEIEQEKNKILSNLKGTDYQNILYVHDYLINNIEYDSTFEQQGSYTIYGALVGKRCVCEGYAKAFKYLTNCAGYECELIQGKATNSSGQTESHAWNCIKLNDKWYEIDTTWDDPIVIGGNGRVTNEIKYRYFLKGTRSFEKDHTLEYQFSEKGRRFEYPNINQNDF